MYLVDTPGVMVPRVSKVEVGLKLGLVGACVRVSPWHAATPPLACGASDLLPVRTHAAPTRARFAAVAGCLRDAVVPDVVLAEFLLEMLNARRATAYVKLFALPGATANIGTVGGQRVRVL